jgi:TonB family protein
VGYPSPAQINPQQQVQVASDKTSEGVRLYEQGETDRAIKKLREAVMIHGNDDRAWHYLGLALIRKGDLKEAREALSKAIEFRNLAFNRFFNFGLNEVRDDQLVRLKTLLHDEIESERKYLETLSDTSSIGFARATLEGLDARSECIEQNTKVTDGHSIFLKSDSKIQRPHILSKPEPKYSTDARMHETKGTVRLKVVFAADGSVKFIDVIQPLPHGLSEEAIKAAARISFEPASICGKRVSWPMELEYHFNIWRRY